MLSLQAHLPDIRKKEWSINGEKVTLAVEKQ